jgi:hypothetical protein
MTIQFGQICPIPHLDLVKGRPFHLTLAHLVEESEEYTEFYSNEDSIQIMDNSAFEMYKQGRDMYESDKLVEMGTRVGADYIALSDYPAEPGFKTIEAAERMACDVKDAGFGTFFIPQSNINDMVDLVETYLWAAQSELVDYIGFSILAIPNASGVEKGNKLQRFASRPIFCHDLEETDFWDMVQDNEKKIHFLGMVDGPNEIQFVNKGRFPIDSWDSSSAIWAGLNGIQYDYTPTGLRDGKFELEVDFNFKTTVNENLGKAIANMDYIDELCEL